MPSKNKRRGNEAEYYFRDKYREEGWDTRRAYASDGRSLGEHEEVDVMAELGGHKERAQVKRRKKFNKSLYPNGYFDVVLLYKDKGNGEPRRTLAILEFDRYLDLVSHYYDE